MCNASHGSKNLAILGVHITVTILGQRISISMSFRLILTIKGTAYNYPDLSTDTSKCG